MGRGDEIEDRDKVASDIAVCFFRDNRWLDPEI